jgi:hypothetical protein
VTFCQPNPDYSREPVSNGDKWRKTGAFSTTYVRFFDADTGRLARPSGGKFGEFSGLKQMLKIHKTRTDP